ncbi:lysophosphatidic acid receptor 2a [Betta splendens]|uniref:Lysophosphatidic acid receptor 2a n=1 Tax=Betta splendens TaxID=158456 RepID=A0A6P7NC87_BETSP|nr:lysophosphatidic acid receptor 2a [Betta splendens]XP_029015747.1 lysophosphatidic acid receptor 2a [Betta splendens]XP_029015748.1 lysophosphatidic acid receptor 2a [Betta splendens]XP_029015749.1 lysophosphatidic acid receptor 2a [Betta splendens]XP_040927868.1 lysophosphatidic acid receptor 2a [Betta splendens]XP_040927869.1 lysophosphatidic acid receptor 2a [Betta splendens]
MATEGTASNSCYYGHNVTFFYNHVGKELSAGWSPRDIAVIALGLTLSVIVILANLLVMVAIFVNRRFHFPIYYLLGNMAAADLFAGVAYANLMMNTGPRTGTLSKEQWYVRGALIDISLTASVANLLAVAMERHQTILTMQLHSQMSKRRVVLLIAGIWAVSVFMGLVPSTFWNCECRLEVCSSVAPLYSRRFLVFWALFNLLTFFIMMAMYTRIFVHVRHQSRLVSQHTSEMWHNEAVVNLMKITCIVLGAFVMCWTPGLVTLLLDGLLGKASRANDYEKYCLVIAECNSLVNPIIYSLRDGEMRSTFKCILCCLCLRRADGTTKSPSLEFEQRLAEEGQRKSEDQALCLSEETSDKEDTPTVTPCLSPNRTH